MNSQPFYGYGNMSYGPMNSHPFYRYGPMNSQPFYGYGNMSCGPMVGSGGPMVGNGGPMVGSGGPIVENVGQMARNEIPMVENEEAAGGEGVTMAGDGVLSSECSCDCLFLRSVDPIKWRHSDNVWFVRSKWSREKLSDITAMVSKEAGTKKRYTNGSIRPTNLTSLAMTGVTPQQIATSLNLQQSHAEQER